MVIKSKSCKSINLLSMGAKLPQTTFIAKSNKNVWCQISYSKRLCIACSILLIEATGLSTGSTSRTTKITEGTRLGSAEEKLRSVDNQWRHNWRN
jgi:hypothetical protein